VTTLSPSRRWRWTKWGIAAVALFWAVRIALNFGLRDVEAPPLRDGSRRAKLVLLVVFLCVVVGWGIWRWTRRHTAARGPGHGPEDLGHPYEMELELAPNAGRVAVRLIVEESGLRLEVRDDRTPYVRLDPPVPAHVPFTDVRALDVGSSRLVLDVTTPAGAQSLPLVPGTYADRQRLLWELAVRRPELFARAPAAAAR
jgi:hypothetical protein